MTPDSWQQVKDVYAILRDRPSDDREDLLNAHCRGDASMIAEVRSLLGYGERADDFLEAPAEEDVAPLFKAHAAQDLVGQRIGPFEIIDVLGYGGMGVVCLSFLKTSSRCGRARRVARWRRLAKKDRENATNVRRFGSTIA